MKKSYLLKAAMLCLFLGAFGRCSFAQTRTLGTWRSFMPYGGSVGICDAGDKVFSAAAQSLFSYDKNTGEIRTYDKASGLSDLGIKTIGYDPAADVVTVAYTNGNIDLIEHETDIYNIPDIKGQNTSGAVAIQDLFFYGGNCYVSSTIGISVINLAKKEVENTYVVGSSGQQIKVYGVSADDTALYAATQEGLKSASFNSSNLLDFNSWHLAAIVPGAMQRPAKFVAAYRQHVYAVIDGNGTDTLVENDQGIWKRLYAAKNNTFTNLRVTDGVLYFTIWNNDSTTAGKQGQIDPSGTLSVNNTQGHVRPIGWFKDNDIAWEGDLWNGLFKNRQGNVENIVPDGPFSDKAFQMAFSGNTLFVAPGGVDDSWVNNFNRDGFFQYNGEKWVNKNQYNNTALSADVPDLLAVATVPSKGKTYFGSFWAGLVEYDQTTGAIAVYNKDNSILEGAQGDLQRTRISALTADGQGNLWISNAGATKPIKILKSNGDWREYTLPYYGILMRKMLIDQRGQLWAPLRSATNGILVWDNKGTLDDTGDDRVRVLGTGIGNGGLPDAVVYSIVEDKDGNIWAGTMQGIGIFYCPGSVFSGCDATQIKVERNGYVGYLFGTESVRAIAVDAANRKWVGTTNGLWLISADGKDELLKFTKDNSPLPSNQITDIAVNDQTGEVFIGTTGGLVSYQGDALGTCTDCNEALVYPNPVKPGYEGPIAVKGLTDGAYVKITDISGTLVFQGRANGTQMIWDGKSYDGQAAKNGVYLVFSSTDMGKDKKMAKIVINR